MLTFLLACVMTCAICIGLTLAVGAGIAYGYHVSLAEFLTFTRSDVTVYVRRGQFADRPEVRPNSRRFGGDGDVQDGNELSFRYFGTVASAMITDELKNCATVPKYRKLTENIHVFSSNFSADYQEENKVPSDDSKPLSDAWQKAQDSRAYADKLTKYSKIKTAVRVYPRAEEEEAVTKLLQPKEPPDDDSLLYTDDKHQDNDYSMITPTLSTNINDQPISRRNLDPTDSHALHMVTRTKSNLNESDIEPELVAKTTDKKAHKHRHKKLRKPDIKIEIADDSKSLYLQPHYNITKHSNRDYSEDLDYIYKSV